MKKNILYISSATSNKMFEEIEKNKQEQTFIYGMPVAANKFHNLMMKGLKDNGCKVSSLSGRPISRKTHSKLLWKTCYDVQDGIKFKYLGFLNLPFLKYIGIGIRCFFSILKWSKDSKDELIIYDAAYVSIMPFIVSAARIKHIKTTAIFSDVYSYMADVDTNNANHSKLAKIVRKIAAKNYEKTTSYVFLSEQMNELINKNNHPYVIIEGIVDTKYKNCIREKNSKKFQMMYAGALRKEYGLKILIEGFSKLKSKNVELLIFGQGDYKDKIIAASIKDNRIKYMGTVSNAEVINFEHNVDLLINPRPVRKDFTKYSFPSKLMEYMSSGTPVLTTKLPTIPVEYQEYLYFIDKNDSESLYISLKKIISTKEEELVSKGLEAKKFIYKYKTEQEQTLKILNMMNR